jgi:AhpD family alkylhydroperoxidase
MNTPMTIQATSFSRDDSFAQANVCAQEDSLDPKLLEVIRLRVAQLCNCQLCIDYHTEILKAHGESDDRIKQLNVWRESSLYEPRERAALALTEALGSDPLEPVPQNLVHDAQDYFNDADILQLTITIFAVRDSNYLCLH